MGKGWKAGESASDKRKGDAAFRSYTENAHRGTPEAEWHAKHDKEMADIWYGNKKVKPKRKPRKSTKPKIKR